MKLKLEVNKDYVSSPSLEGFAYAHVGIVTTPFGLDKDEIDYWIYRVKLSDTQAIIGFPKYGQIGIGFEKEEDSWNTNKPSTKNANEIFDWIKRNKGDDNIKDSDCIKAIELIQQTILELNNDNS